MVTNVFSMMNSFHPDPLVTIGWLAFVIGFFVEQKWLKLIFLSAARVLP